METLARKLAIQAVRSRSTTPFAIAACGKNTAVMESP
jgi:hypothetical protein